MIYSKMSDFEINKEVAKKLGMKIKTEFDNKFGFTERYHAEYPSTVWAAECANGRQFSPWEQVCYTGDWADIGPIIEKYGIDIEWPEDHLGSIGSCKKYRQGDTDIIVEFKLKSQALRTAAIVFLMIEVKG